MEVNGQIQVPTFFSLGEEPTVPFNTKSWGLQSRSGLFAQGKDLLPCPRSNHGSSVVDPVVKEDVLPTYTSSYARQLYFPLKVRETLRNIRWAGHVTGMGERKVAYQVLVE